ncbi:MAG: efflux RND transporter periplasmic adaptor subunit [bacterium]|nr:efflux RND transporter periplasmic adaptor subunit [bacterium]
MLRSCLAAVVLTGCTEESAPVARQIVVESAPPLVQDVEVKLDYPVELQADEAVSITPVAISGFLRRVLVDVGDKVKAGQLIALVDCREYSAKRTQAETMIAKRKAQVDESRSQLERLEKMGEGLVAPAEIDRAEADARVAEAELADARAKLSEAGQRQGYCSMTAPFSGFVTDRFLDPGAMVSPGGQPVVKIVKSRDVRVVASIIEEDAPKVGRDAVAEVVLHAFPDSPFPATVARVGRALDPATRTLRIEMSIPKSTEVMLPGMTGRASIVIDTNEDSMLVPFTSVLKLEETAYVYVVAEDEQGVPRAKRVEVELGVDLGDWVEVTSGISPTDNVIYTGRELVDDGTEVKISETPPAFAAPTEDGAVDMDKQPPGQEEQAAADAAEAQTQAQARANKSKKRRGKKRAGEADTDGGDLPSVSDDGDDTGEETSASPPAPKAKGARPAKSKRRRRARDAAATTQKGRSKADSTPPAKPEPSTPEEAKSGASATSPSSSAPSPQP